MGDAPTHTPLRLDLGLNTASNASPQTQRGGAAGVGGLPLGGLKVKLDIRDVVRREAYRPELNARVRRDEFRGTSREEERSMRRGAFWNHVNNGVAYSWVSDHGLVVSDEEKELAFKYFRGGEGVGKLNEFNVWPKLKVAPNAPNAEEFAALELFIDGENPPGASWDSLHKLLDYNELEDFDPVREAFLLIDENRSGLMSRTQVKEMAEKWGIGEITEEDVDDLFRAVGANPQQQSTITVNEYRDLIRTDLSNKEGVRVKLVDQMVEQPLVLVTAEAQRARGGSPPRTRGTPTAAGAPTARTLVTFMQNRPSSASTRPPSANTARTSPTPTGRSTPDSPFASSSPIPSSPTRAVRPSSPMKVAIPTSPTRASIPSPTRTAFQPTSPTRTTRPSSPFRTASPVRPASPSRPTPSRPSTASPSRPSTASPSRPSTPARPISPARPTSPLRSSTTTLNSMRPASPAPRPASPIRAQPPSPIYSSSPAKPNFSSPPTHTSPPSKPSFSRSRSESPISTGPYPHTTRTKSKDKSEKPSVVFADVPDEETKTSKTTTMPRLDRSSSSGSTTGSMKINLALKKAEEILKKEKAANGGQFSLATPTDADKSLSKERRKSKG